MIFTNEQLLSELHNVRNRQIPWQKRSAFFSELQILGLVAKKPQQTQSENTKPKLNIAVLTDFGRFEFKRLKALESESDWHELRQHIYSPSPSDS